MIVTIDGKEVVCEPGELLLSIAERAGISIPALCHHEGFPEQGCCRVCIVEVAPYVHSETVRREIVAACIYPVDRECTVFTDSERIRRNRGIALALLRARAPASDEIGRLCRVYGAPDLKQFTTQSENEKCILCGLCVKACESLGTGAISTVGRGVGKKVSTPYDEPALVCVGCGSCAAVCPTGAIPVTEDNGVRTIWGKKLPLALCKRCGTAFGTMFELYRASEHSGSPPPEFCPECRRKAITDTIADTFGH